MLANETAPPRYESGGDANFSVILGAGLDVAVSKRLAIRPLQADWMHITGDYPALWLPAAGRAGLRQLQLIQPIFEATANIRETQSLAVCYALT